MAKQGKNWNVKGIVREIVVLGIMIVSIMAIRSTVASHYRVPTGSMIPTILPGDHFFAYQAAYSWRVPFAHIHLSKLDAPKRGDIVVFPSPVEKGIDLVKRVVAVEGDTLEVRDGFLVINGQEAQTEFIETDPNGFQVYWENLGDIRHKVQLDPRRGNVRYMPELKIPEGYFFPMGDNRDNSADGRYFGPVEFSQIRGRALFVLYSLDATPPFVHFGRTGTSLTCCEVKAP